MDVAPGEDPPAEPSGKYYRRKRKRSDPISALSLPANRVRSWECGSVTKEWESLYAQKVQLLTFLSTLREPTLSYAPSAETNMVNSIEQTEQKKRDIIILDSDDEDESTAAYKQLTPEKNKQPTPEKNKQLIPSEQAGTLTRVATKGIDEVNETMHDRDQNSQIVPYSQSATLMNHYPLPSYQPTSVLFERVILQKRPEEERIHDLAVATHKEKIAETQVFPALPKERKKRKVDPSSQVDGDAEIAPRKRKRKNEANPAVFDLPSETYNPVEEDEPMGEDEPMEEEDKPEKESDGLEDIWNDFSVALESSKLDTLKEVASEKEVGEKEVENVCNHDIRIHEDLGHVCRVCGMIVRRADTIIDYQWKKASRSRSYFYETRSKDSDEIVIGDVRVAEELIALDIAIHPRHEKQMRPHQLAGFHFLVKNLVSDKPGGCILAHAPGSGKTFMLISFIQSFLAKYPSGRPLVVLPKGILGTWKREFQRWQVEDIPLYDLYSVKGDRTEQLEILNSWQANRSILLVGYAQFSWIISSDGGGAVAAACRDMLLMVPNLLIMDEGHTPRNEATNVLESLRRVQTPRKVVLSGTLFQNHVAEVFNILNLVRPKFLKMESSRPIVTRMMSQVSISGGRISKGATDRFTESVEETLLHDGNFTRKAHVIRSLRELTKDVLHYYKGDILDELPGLVDLSVFLKLSPKQKEIVHKLEAYEKFKKTAVGTALYMHPCLSEMSEVDAADRASSSTDAAVDSLVQSINVADGVKARFFTNILALAESAGEKVLAFSQYLLPMKFLERLLVKTRGWHVGKEIFVIRGDNKSNTEERELAVDQFNNSADAKVLFGSIKACGEGISLVGASRVVILDVHLNPSVTRQAIGRAFRPGQQKKVFVYRLVAADSPEENTHETAFKKEVIPKLWFEWSEQRCTSEDFQLNEVNIDDCGDELLDNRTMRQDIKALYTR